MHWFSDGIQACEPALEWTGHRPHPSAFYAPCLPLRGSVSWDQKLALFSPRAIMEEDSDAYGLLPYQLDAMSGNKNPIFRRIRNRWHEVDKALAVVDQPDE